jgi:hypothetical protein
MQERSGCQIEFDECKVRLVSPLFEYSLDISQGLVGVSVENRLSGRTLSLGCGPEFGADFDKSFHRSWIAGWKVLDSGASGSDPDQESGFLKGFHDPGFHDRDWLGAQTPNAMDATRFAADHTLWARTHVFLPEECKGKKVTLLLGGMELMDFQSMRVFLNGRPIGVREVSARWNEPGSFEIDSTSGLYTWIHFGGDNVIAIQASGYTCRTSRLDEVDPLHVRDLSTSALFWSCQFEQCVVVGEVLDTPEWKVIRCVPVLEGPAGEMRVELESCDGRFHAAVAYRWNADEPTLHKTVRINNRTPRTLRLMNVRLGAYDTDAPASDGDKGFPVYIGDDHFLTLAHPAGWATGEGSRVRLRQFPGVLLDSGAIFDSMETVLGMAAKGDARKSFLRLIGGRMRRRLRNHEGIVKIYEPFGAWPQEELEREGIWESEKIVLDNLRRLEPVLLEEGFAFDYFSIDFWADVHGDFIRTIPDRFPDGLATSFDRIKELGMAPGLWIDSSMGRWGIGANPVVAACRTYDFAAYDAVNQDTMLRETFCHASDPFRSLFRNAFIHHLKENGVRLLKFDNCMSTCHNPNHEHLPGIYSTEAIHDSLIQDFQAFDRSCPDVFIMLYWGYRSPWWLPHVDTLFESGLHMESCSPAAEPTRYARDGVILTLDQGSAWCADVPALGRDTLGFWLSDWAWNSSIGRERWVEGMLMDMMRGSNLFQPWGHPDWPGAMECRTLGTWGRLFESASGCIRNCVRILGDPWRTEPYGYCGSDGERAFISLFNCVWRDSLLELTLGPQWGLPEGVEWDVYQWHPERVKWERDARTGSMPSLVLRPFDIVLLEVVPRGTATTMKGDFKSSVMGAGFPEESRRVELSSLETSAEDEPTRVYQIQGVIPSNQKGGTLIVTVQQFDGGIGRLQNDIGTHWSASAGIEGGAVATTPILGSKTYASAWQGWRIEIQPEHADHIFKVDMDSDIEGEYSTRFSAWFIPFDGPELLE